MRTQSRPWHFLAFVALAAPSGAVAQAGSDASALVTRSAWLQAYANGDEAALAGLLRDDFTVIASTGELASKSEIIAQAQKPPAKLTMTPSEVSLRREGPVALVTSKVTEQRAGGSIEFRVTDVLVRARLRTGRSPPPTGPAPSAT